TTIALRQIKSFAELFSDGERPSVAAVDMPIGLPERTGPKGRTPERLVRSLLGARQSSVFSIPSRAAVYAGADADEPDERTRFLSACDIARATSAQGRGSWRSRDSTSFPRSWISIASCSDAGTCCLRC